MATSPKVAAGVEGDPRQPGRELRVAAKASDLLDKGAADLLRDVVGIRARSGQPPRETVDSIIVTTEQRLERLAIAGNGRGDKIDIRIPGNIPHPLRPHRS